MDNLVQRSEYFLLELCTDVGRHLKAIGCYNVELPTINYECRGGKVDRVTLEFESGDSLIFNYHHKPGKFPTFVVGVKDIPLSEEITPHTEPAPISKLSSVLQSGSEYRFRTAYPYWAGGQHIHLVIQEGKEPPPFKAIDITMSPDQKPPFKSVEVHSGYKKIIFT